MTTAAPPPWTRPEWTEAATVWIRRQLDRLGIALAGPIERPHVRPWSAVLRVPTDDGTLFFKACADTLAHEVALTKLLAEHHPTTVPELLASDWAHGWLLMRDGGVLLREILRRDRDPGPWQALLPRYAELQIELIDRVPECLALGVPDRRTAKLPELFDALLRDRDALRVGEPGGLAPDHHERLLRSRSELEDLCRRLTDTPIPDSLHHGDLHDGNIFAPGDRFPIFDWGDASVSHPFFSLRTVFVSLEISLGLDGDLPSPLRERLRDAYLEPWGRFQARDELVADFERAARLSPLSSALGWQRALRPLDATTRRDHLHVLPALTLELLGGLERDRS